MKAFWIIPASALALAACGAAGDVAAKLADNTEEARAALASQTYLEGLAQSSLDGFSAAISDAVAADESAGAPAFRALAQDKVYNLEGEVDLAAGGRLAFEKKESSLTLRDGKPGKLIVRALQNLVDAKAGEGKFDVAGDVTYAADLTYGTGGLFGDMTVAGSLTLTNGSLDPVTWSATIAVTGLKYTVELLVDGKPKSIGNGKAAALFPILALFKAPETPDEPVTPVCGTKVTTADYVASVTTAQSGFDYLETNDPAAMGSPVSDVTVCFKPATGGGYDIYAARTDDYPIRAVTGYTGPANPADPKFHYLANDFVFYGQTQTTVVVNASGALFFDAAAPVTTAGYVWPWFLDGTKAVVGSSWDARDGYSTYSFLITETASELVVSASAAAAGSYTGRADLQMILKLDTNEVILNYGRYDMFGIAPGIYSGKAYNDPGAYKIVEFIPGTGLTYSPY